MSLKIATREVAHVTILDVTGRIVLGEEIHALRDALPAYAKDLSLSLSTLAGETLLTEQQKWGAFVASAHALSTPPSAAIRRGAERRGAHRDA